MNVVIGPNSAGKSSLLSPLLLLKQTLRSSDAALAIVTKGPLAHVGQFSDFVHGHDTARTVRLEFRYHGHETTRTLAEVSRFEDPPGEIGVELRLGEKPSEIVLSRLDILDLYQRRYMSRVLKKDGKYSIEGPIADRTANAYALKQLEEQRPRGFLFEPLMLTQWSDPDADRKPPPAGASESLSLYNAITSTTRRELERTLNALAFVGPMRERPQRFYEHAGESPATVGPRGEHAYELLFRESGTLQSRINNAMKRLGLADGVECVELSGQSEVFAVQLRMGSLCFNLADSGFGVSQLLPILIQGFRDPRDRYACLIVKQPEIHLNPLQQCVLAELLVEMMPHTQLIIETHSEHILVTLRRLVAQKRLAASDLVLHYVDRTEDGTSRIRQVPIADNGHIEPSDWPSEFFGDLFRESLALAEAQMKTQAVAQRPRKPKATH